MVQQSDEQQATEKLINGIQEQKSIDKKSRDV